MVPERSDDRPQPDAHLVSDLAQRESLRPQLHDLLTVEDLPGAVRGQVLPRAAVDGLSDAARLVVAPNGSSLRAVET